MNYIREKIMIAILSVIVALVVVAYGPSWIDHVNAHAERADNCRMMTEDITYNMMRRNALQAQRHIERMATANFRINDSTTEAAMSAYAREDAVVELYKNATDQHDKLRATYNEQCTGR
jgi:hypothetical protein